MLGDPMRRRLFLGDVQGCRAELERLLEELRYDPAADELYPVGDLVNRGPDSLGSLRLLRELGSRHPGGSATCARYARAHNLGESRVRRAFVRLEGLGLLLGHGAGRARIFARP